MRFGRVEGVVEPVERAGQTWLALRVFLDSTNGLTLVRDEVVASLPTPCNDGDLSWQADQYTQETIGVHLASEGWEVIGAGEIPERTPGELARSASYAVRLL